MSIGNKVTNMAHRSLVIVLVGIAAYSFIGAGVVINRRFDKSKEMHTRQELQKFSQQHSVNDNITTEDKKS